MNGAEGNSIGAGAVEDDEPRARIAELRLDDFYAFRPTVRHESETVHLRPKAVLDIGEVDVRTVAQSGSQPLPFDPVAGAGDQNFSVIHHVCGRDRGHRHFLQRHDVVPESVVVGVLPGLRRMGHVPGHHPLLSGNNRMRGLGQAHQEAAHQGCDETQ
ncbi:hypothetical protein [Streptomyces sp. NPDC002394]